MSRPTLISFAVATLFAFTGCEKKDTNVPGGDEAEADFAPEEGDEDEELEGGPAADEEEKAPNLSARSREDAL